MITFMAMIAINIASFCKEESDFSIRNNHSAWLSYFRMLLSYINILYP